MKKAAFLFLVCVTTSCGDAESGTHSEFETTEQSLKYSKSSSSYEMITLHAPSKTDKVGPRDLTAVPDVQGVYTCCDSNNNCYDIDLDEDCALGETLLWCMGDGLCEPGKNTD